MRKLCLLSPLCFGVVFVGVCPMEVKFGSIDARAVVQSIIVVDF